MIYLFGVFGSALSAVVGLSVIFFNFSSSKTLEFMIFNLIWMEYSFSVSFDTVSSGYLICVLLVSSCIMGFTGFYMKGTVNYRRFLYTMLLFVFSMALLVSADNFITLLVGWDGLGVTSFCLVIFYESSSSIYSGILTVFTNRLGDSAFMCSLYYLMAGGGLTMSLTQSTNWAIFLLIISGAMTKSAQIPFCSWLPAAMAAPTPVSALVHSSTLVTAGVYVLMRFNYLFHSNLLLFVTISLLTMLLAGLSALKETDLKKLVAMSTLSQLGFMLFGVSLGLWKMSLFHMMLHSFFKSMMFISAGGLMLSMMGVQDFRWSASSLNSKLSMAPGIMSMLCLSGYPFILGFYSKDVILSNSMNLMGGLILETFTLGCLITVVYSYRFIRNLYSTNFLKTAIFLSENKITYLLSFVTLMVTVSFFGPSTSLLLPVTTAVLPAFDMLLGLLVFLSSILMLKLILGTGKTSANSMTSMIFMNWLSSGGISKVMIEAKVHSFEKSWFGLTSYVSHPLQWLKKSVNFDFYESLKYMLTITPLMIFYLM